MTKQNIVGLLIVLVGALIMSPQAILAQHQGMGGMQHPGMSTMAAKTGALKGKLVQMAQGTIIVEGK